MLLLHSVLGKRYFKPEYQKTILSLRKSIDQDYVKGRLENVFPTSFSKELFNLAMQGDFQGIINKKSKYIGYFIIRSPSNFGLLSLRWLWWKRKRAYPLISVIGPDGAGKSTMAESLRMYLEQQGKKTTIVYTGRGRDQLLPFGAMGRRYKSKEKQKDKVRKPSLWKRKFLYTSMMPLFALDLWLRYWFRIFPQLLQGRVVVTDRYCTDLMLMQHVPVWLKKGALWLFPKPALTFYLYNNSDVLHARREEESAAELERQLKLFAILEKSIKPIKIKTENLSKNKEEVFTLVMELLYQKWY